MMNKDEVKYRNPNWGLHGLKTQPKDRSGGVKHAKIYAKAEGLSSYGADPKESSFFDKMKKMMMPEKKPMMPMPEKKKEEMPATINKNEREMMKQIEGY